MRIVRRFVVSIAMFCVVSTAFGAEWKLGEPIVTYYVAPKLSDAVAKQMAEGGWNLVWAWSEAELDVAHKHGLRAMFRHNLLIPGAKALDDPNKRKQLDALVDKVCKHPALYCYYVLDEPAAKDFPAGAQMGDYLRRRDPQHMAYVNLLPGGMVKKGLGTIADKAEYDKYQEYLDEFIRVVKPELLGYDRYQFAVAGVLEGYFQNLEQMRQTAQRAGLPFMNIVQACTWDAKLMRVPTDNEMRYLVYTTLAYGAQGISYYVYRYPGHEGGIATADGAPTSIYHVLKQANREFAAIATEYQSLRSLGAYHVGMQPAGARPLLPILGAVRPVVGR